MSTACNTILCQVLAMNCIKWSHQAPRLLTLKVLPAEGIPSSSAAPQDSEDTHPSSRAVVAIGRLLRAEGARLCCPAWRCSATLGCAALS
eukprot:6200778-Pleurochrysis_carterae.AAC.1